MKTTITIDMDGAAFSPSETGGWTYEGLAEVARILRDLADRLDADDVRAPVLDVNGNRCGSFLLHD